MQEYVLNGKNMNSRVNAHSEIAAALELPAWYGGNLDALADVLAGLHAVVRITDTAAMLNALEMYGCKMLQVFYDSPVELILE